MSTSPDAPQGQNVAPQSPAPKLLWANRGPVLTLLKGLLWLILAIALVAALAMNYEVVWDVLAQTVPVVFQFIEDALTTFFVAVAQMNPAFAPMATAYTLFVIALVLVYLLTRRGITVYQKIQTRKEQISQTYASAWQELYGNLKQAFLAWWESLDLMNKVVSGVFIVLIGIPVALLLSYMLGTLVASLL
jgi:hypothetical protein